MVILEFLFRVLHIWSTAITCVLMVLFILFVGAVVIAQAYRLVVGVISLIRTGKWD